MKRLSFYFLFFFSKILQVFFFFFFFFQKYYKFFGFGMTWGFSRPVTRRSVLAGCRPARRQAWYIGWPWVCRPRAARPARRQAWYIYGPIFFSSRAWLQPPARDDPSLLGLSRAGLAASPPDAKPGMDGHGSAERGPWRFGLLPARPQSAGGWYIHKIFF